MTLTYSIPSSQSFASGDCINIALNSNPYVSVLGGYTPFTDITGCAITSGPSLSSCRIPTSTTSTGQNYQVIVGGTATSKAIVATFKFNNPYSQRSLSMGVSFLKSCTGSQLGSSSITLSFKTGTISDVILTSNSDTIGQTNAVLTVQLKVGTTFRTQGRIELEVPEIYTPTDGSTATAIDSSLTVPSVSSSAAGSAKGITVTSRSFDSIRSLLIIDYTITSTIASGTYVIFSCSNFRNPISTTALTGFKVWTYEVQTSGSAALIDSTGTTLWSFSKSSWNPQTMKNGAVTLLDSSGNEQTKIGQKDTTLQIYYEVTMPLLTNCYLKVQFPREIRINVDSETLNSVTGDGFMSSASIVSIVGYSESGSGSSITMSGNYVIVQGCNSQHNGYSQSTTMAFSDIISPAQVKEVTDFTLTLSYDSTFATSERLAIGSSSQNFMIPRSKLVSGTITDTSMSLTPTNLMVQETTTYTAVFTVVSGLYKESMIEITIPTTSKRSGTSVTCSVSGLSASTSPTCTWVSSGTVIQITNPFTESSSGGFDFKPSSSSQYILTVAFTLIQNPTSSKQAGSWKVSTYNMIGGSYYVVDTGTKSTSFVPTQGFISKAQAIDVIPSTTSYDLSVYTFYLTVPHNIPTQGRVIITLPTSGDITISSVAMIRSSCSYYSYTSSQYISQVCSVSGTSITMQLSSQHDKANVLKIQFQGLKNPRTKKVSDTFTFKTMDTDELSLIDDSTTDLTFKVTMINLATMTAGMTLTPNNFTNGAITSYVLTFVSPITLASGDQIVMTFDSNVKPRPTSGAASGTLSCIGLLSVTTVTCSYASNVLTFGLTTVTGTATTYSINITTVVNPPSTQEYLAISSALFKDVSGNELMSLTTATGKVQMLYAASLQTFSLSQSKLDTASLAQYTISFKTYNSIPAAGSILITWPSQIYYTTVPRCTVTASGSYSTCTFTNSSRTVLISGVFGSTQFSGTVTVVIDSFMNPSDNRQSSGFTIWTYADTLQTYKVDKLDDGYIKPLYKCVYPCKTCSSSDSSYCQSCWQDTGSPYLMTNSTTSLCKQGCDTGYTTNGDTTNKVCVACDASCKTCVDNGASGDKSRCLTCADSYQYKYTPNQQCLKNCTTTGLYESSPFICSLCNSSCLTCSKSSKNCTSCNPKTTAYKYLYVNQCIDTCPSGFVSQVSTCDKCDSKCLTCTNNTATCTSCDQSSKYKFFFGFNCIEQCPSGTQPDYQKLLCYGCLQGCSLCDSKNQTKCLKCESPLLEFQGACLKTCPDGYSPNFYSTACTTKWFNFDFATIPYPHLIACGVMLIFCLIGEIKDSKKTLFITSFIVLWGPIEFISYLSLTYFGILYEAVKFAGASGFAAAVYVILNISFSLAFYIKIARKDIEYMLWRSKYPKTSNVLLILSGLLSFKILRLHYCHLYGFDCFKARFQFPGVFQRLIIVFTVIHFIFVNSIVLCLDIVGIISLGIQSSQLSITMLETGIIIIIMMTLDFMELCNLKKYLGEDAKVDYDALLNQMNETMDKKLRQDMLKQIMNHVKGNKDTHLNNRFDELLTEMGPRRCRSMVEFGNELEDDPRRTRSMPVSPRGEGEFDNEYLPTLDNVYAEAKPADPLANMGKTFSDFDSQVMPKNFDKIVSRKGGDFVQFEQTDNGYKRSRAKKPRGRKNQYYTQIDAEDDEEADGLGDREDENGVGDDLDVIKEEDDEDNVKKKLKKQQKLEQAKKEQEEKERLEKERKAKEEEDARHKREIEEKVRKEREDKEKKEREVLEKLHQEQEAKKQQELKDKKLKEEEERKKKEELKKKQESEALAKQEELKKKEELDKEMHRLEEERLKKEREDAVLKAKEEAEAKRLEEEIAQQELKARQLEKPASAISKNQDVLMNSQPNLHQFNQQDAVVQAPPDSQRRNFNENDILGDLDRDDKGNIIVLQDDSGNNVDKQGRAVNERGYLKDPASGDIVENYQNKKMFDYKDIDERGEIPAPFCVEKHNFNPHSVRGELDYDRAGRPVFAKGKNGELLDKKGALVNKRGWLIDPQGNLCDNHGRKKFDRKQMTSEGDFPRLFTLGGRRFDVLDVCGQLNRDAAGQFLFKKNKKGQNVDNQGKLVNEKGYLIDELGNVIDKDKKKMFEKKYLKNGEFPKIFPFTKFNIKRILGNFEMDPIGNPILDKGPNGELLDRDRQRVNQRGYLVDADGNIIDKLGKKMFEKEILDAEGEIPKVFRTGLLKSDTASSLSRLMSEIEKNQPSEYGNPQWRRQQQKEELLKKQREEQERQKQLEALEHMSGNTSVDSMMEDTPSNYNLANQRFDQTNDLLTAKSHQLQQQQFHPPAGSQPRLLNAPQVEEDEDEEEVDTQFDGDFAGNDDNLMKKRRIRKKKKVVVVQQYHEPSEKDIKMARAYGGVPKGNAKKVVKTTLLNRELHTPGSINNHQSSKANINKVSGAIAGFQRDLGSRGEQRAFSSMQNLEEMKEYPAQLNDSNEASMLAVPEHHLREQRLKQRKMNELKSKKQRRTKGGDPDFEKMFGKDIDEFLEDSDWDIESFDNMSNFSKGTTRTANQDGRIRGLESIYLQRIETSMKKGGVTTQKKPGVPKRQPAGAPKFRPMQDRFVNDPTHMMPDADHISGLVDPSQQSSLSQSRLQRHQFLDSANATTLPHNNVFSRQQKQAQTQYKNTDASRRM